MYEGEKYFIVAQAAVLMLERDEDLLLGPTVGRLVIAAD